MTLILDSPVKGILHIDALNYPKHPAAWQRPGGNHDAAITHDFGPSTVTAEPTIKWPGGETDIYGHRIPAGTYPNFHCAIDMSCGGAKPAILAPADGRVIYAGKLIGGSLVVVIRHAGGLATGSGHMSSPAVKTGQTVKRGQKVGVMGETGVASGIHDHFAVKVDFPSGLTGAAAANAFYNDGPVATHGRFVNPLRFLRQFITIHPRALEGINIRFTAGVPGTTTLGPKYATTKLGHIVRLDGKVLGRDDEAYDWGGTVAGATYPAGPGYASGNQWQRIELEGAYRYIAAPLAALSNE